MIQKVKLIATATDLHHPGYKQLIRSLKHYKWDYDIISDTYKAYGSKMINAYNYAKKTDCSHLFIVDGYDIFVLGSMVEALARITDTDCVLFNAEKACWPYPEWEKHYPNPGKTWRYLNGGAAFVEVKKFIQLFEENPIQHLDNDQVNLAKIFLEKRDRYNMQLDVNCQLFQSVAFEHPGDFDYVEFTKEGILSNNIEKTWPIIAHGNGRTDMSKVYSLLK